MKFTVGGRPLDLTKEQVERAMRRERPEPIHKHVVEMIGTVFPPKQVLAAVTGWDRTSFTTMEAQRVLTRLGFTCRRADTTTGGTPAWMPVDPDEEAPDENVSGVDQRLDALSAAVATAQAAIAGLLARVEALERR